MRKLPHRLDLLLELRLQGHHYLLSDGLVVVRPQDLDGVVDPRNLQGSVECRWASGRVHAEGKTSLRGFG